jgi:tRNA/rRNA methyltransferase
VVKSGNVTVLPSVALVDPQFSLNVGYVARVMANFGLENLFIVSGNSSHINWDEATKFASHGQPVVKRIRVVKSIPSLRTRHTILVGTTAIRARKRSNISRTTMDFETFMPTLAKTIGRNPKGLAKTCFVFGRDTTGLTNEEIRLCDYVVTINTGTEYRTLNISHAVSIVLYEIAKYFRKSKMRNEQNSERLHKHFKEHDMVVKLFLELAEVSDFQAHKRPKLAETLLRIINRGNPSLRETYLLLGLASKAKTRIVQLEKNQASS